ncbi:MAG: tetratricopeptide repeat protein [Desulfobacca sp.]|nr:tetratricopeptide repeat protein [Desulfobacca sp.]
MAKKITGTRKPLDNEEDKFISFSNRLIEFSKSNLKVLVLGLTVVILAAAGWGIFYKINQQRAIKAAELLQTVRPALSQPEAAAKNLEALQKVISNYPKTGAALQASLFRAQLLYQEKKYAEAAAIYESLRGQDAGLDVLLTESLSFCYEGQQRFQPAAEVLEVLVKDAQLPYRGELLRRQALLFEQAGDKVRALSCYRQLLGLSSGAAFAPLIKEKIHMLEQKQG